MKFSERLRNNMSLCQYKVECNEGTIILSVVGVIAGAMAIRGWYLIATLSSAEGKKIMEVAQPDAFCIIFAFASLGGAAAAALVYLMKGMKWLMIAACALYWTVQDQRKQDQSQP
jgi:hypothetical protein